MNTFKKILFLAISILSAHLGFSQEIGIRGGLNISHLAEKMVGDNFFDDPWLKPSFHFGATISFTLIKSLALETGVLYSSKGLRNKGKSGFDQETTYLEKLNLSYLEVPLNIKVKIFERDLSLYGFGGGYFGYALWGNLYKNSDISKDEVFRARITWEKGSEYPMKRLDYGVNMGFEVKNNRSSIGINYQLGLAKISYYKSYYNRTLEIYYKYQLWNN